MSGDAAKDYYGILGAKSDAPRDEIERRYKRLASERHPDRGGDEEGMKALNEAYGVLRDAARRTAYDSARQEAHGSRPPAADDSVRRAGRHGVAAAEAWPPQADTYAPQPSAAAQADAVGGRAAGALLAVFAGLVLLFLVRFHYVVFLWPLALVAGALVLFGVWMAHAAMTFARGNFAPGHLARRTWWAQEAVFWASVAAGCFVVYLLLTEL